jgi:2-amino-4-hydroxy-6-hydroxymethyldihydropteridine diphosphokinase
MNTPSPATAYLALGSNLGDRLATLNAALQQLGAHGVEVEDVSSFIETEPVGGPAGQGPYLNGAARVRTDLQPRQLLDVLLSIEAQLGRERRHAERNTPRTVDLDILFYEDQVIEEEGLCVPHPRLHQRMFVLEPLAQIAPDRVHPAIGRSVAELLRELTETAK